MQFIQIKPNNDKNLNQILLDHSHKLASPSEYEYYYELKKDFITALKSSDSIIEHKMDDPINYINNYFEEKNKNISLDQKYKILAYDIKDDNILYIMIIDVLLNNNTYNISLPEDIIMENANIIASNMVKYYNNSLAILGDVFIIGIDKNIYESDNKKKVNNKNVYYNFDINLFVESFTNINYIKIMLKPNNNIIVYNREILESYLENNNYEIINEHNLLKFNHNNNTIYVKFCDTLIDSYKNILFSMPDSVKCKNNIYYINITNQDIEYILSL